MVFAKDQRSPVSYGILRSWFSSAGLRLAWTLLLHHWIHEVKIDLRQQFETLAPNVLIVQDLTADRGFDKYVWEGTQTAKLEIVCQGSMDTDGWDSLCNMRDETHLSVAWNLDGKDFSSEDIALILVTSGTTHLPEACGYTVRNLNSRSTEYIL
ncbi:MAG: hypothetical protein Q9224_000004 [Gallowayella concinna]